MSATTKAAGSRPKPASSRSSSGACQLNSGPDLLIDALTSLPAEHWRLFMVTTADQAADTNRQRAQRSNQ